MFSFKIKISNELKKKSLFLYTKSGLFVIWNTKRKIGYIGHSKNVHTKLNDHKHQLIKKIHPNTKL
jgi:hypothetical protein